jgi:hypothetical protein
MSLHAVLSIFLLLLLLLLCVCVCVCVCVCGHLIFLVFFLPLGSIPSLLTHNQAWYSGRNVTHVFSCVFTCHPEAHCPLTGLIWQPLCQSRWGLTALSSIALQHPLQPAPNPISWKQSYALMDSQIGSVMREHERTSILVEELMQSERQRQAEDMRAKLAQRRAQRVSTAAVPQDTAATTAVPD